MRRALAVLALALAASASAGASMRYCVGDGYLAVVFDSTSAANGRGKVYAVDARKDIVEPPLEFSFKPESDVSRISCEPGGFRVTMDEHDAPFDLTIPGKVVARPLRPAARATGRDASIDAGCATESQAIEIRGRPNVWFVAEAFADEDRRQRVYKKQILFEKYQGGDEPPGRLLETLVVHTYPVLCEGDEYDR